MPSDLPPIDPSSSDEYDWYLRCMRGEITAQQVVEGYDRGDIDVPLPVPLTGDYGKDYLLIEEGLTVVSNPWDRPLRPIPPDDAAAIAEARDRRAQEQRNGH